MAEFGLTRTPGLVVEGDSGHYLNGYPYYLLPDYATDTESGTLDGIDTSRRVLLQMAQGITITETEASLRKSAGQYRELLQQGGGL